MRLLLTFFFFSSRRRHTRLVSDWSSDVCSSDLGSDEEMLQWCFSVGRKPSEDDIYVWNEFMRKRGWNDEVSEILNRRKAEAGMSDRSDIETSFQFIDADEGRLPSPG